MNGDKKLRQEQRQKMEEENRQEAETSAREFSTVEEMLRWDAAHVRVPEGLAARLKQASPAQPRRVSWWRRLFGGRDR